MILEHSDQFLSSPGEPDRTSSCHGFLRQKKEVSVDQGVGGRVWIPENELAAQLRLYRQRP